MRTKMLLMKNPTILRKPQVHLGPDPKVTTTGAATRTSLGRVQGIGGVPRRKVEPHSLTHAPSTCYLRRAGWEGNALRFWPGLFLR